MKNPNLAGTLTSLHPFESQVARAWPTRYMEGVTSVVAVSGGADSVALLRALHSVRGHRPAALVVAHLNHRLRGRESHEDQKFVEDLCQRLELPCQVESLPEGWSAHRGSDGLEAAAREARYDFLRRTACRVGARYVLTAHTADDQAETILHRVVRGTGIAGLAGISQLRSLGPSTLVRPLLGLRRTELLAYLGDLEQPYRTDPSNEDLQFTRNRIRHELLPWLSEQFNPSVVEALVRLGTLAGEVQAFIDTVVEDHYERAVQRCAGDRVEVNAGPLRQLPPYLVRELFVTIWRRQGWPRQAMGYCQWDLLAQMLRAADDEAGNTLSKRMFPGAVLAEIHNRRLRLSPSAEQENWRGSKAHNNR